MKREDLEAEREEREDREGGKELGKELEGSRKEVGRKWEGK